MEVDMGRIGIDLQEVVGIGQAGVKKPQDGAVDGDPGTQPGGGVVPVSLVGTGIGHVEAGLHLPRQAGQVGAEVGIPGACHQAGLCGPWHQADEGQRQAGPTE